MSIVLYMCAKPVNRPEPIQKELKGITINENKEAR